MAGRLPIGVPWVRDSDEPFENQPPTQSVAYGNPLKRFV